MTVLLIIFVLTDTDNERYPRQKKPVDVTLLEAVFQLLQGKCKYERSQQGANNAGLNLQKLATKWPNRKKLAVSRKKTDFAKVTLVFTWVLQKIMNKQET